MNDTHGPVPTREKTPWFIQCSYLKLIRERVLRVQRRTEEYRVCAAIRAGVE